MLNQFSRTQLIFGKSAMDSACKSKVAVFGIGGVGGYTVEALARSGVGTLDLIDDDKVCLTNINRQIYALRSTVGKFIRWMWQKNVFSTLIQNAPGQCLQDIFHARYC